MIKSAVGLSRKVQDHRMAGKEAAEEARHKLEEEKASIVFAFASIQYDQEEVLKGIMEVFPDVTIVGGSAAGEITSWATVFDGVNVMAIASDKITFTTGLGHDVLKDSPKASADAAKDLLSKLGGEKPDLVISLFDGMTGDGAGLVDGVKSVLGDNIPLIGGSFGDDYKFEKTYGYYDGKVLSDIAVLIGLKGEFSYGFGIRHGWEPVGLPLKVTKADGTLLQEVGGKPALSVYEEHFGKEASELVKEPLARMAYTYPIGIEVEGSDELLIRDPVIANKKGEITMAAAIPEGATIRLMIGDRDKAIEAAKTAAGVARDQLEGGKPEAIIMFNCMARNKLLGVRCSEENNAVQKVIGDEVPMMGFYTYGEHGPLLGKKGTPAYFHNETMTLLVLGSK
jgi:hypothetical protein